MADAKGEKLMDVQRTEKDLQAYLREKTFSFPNIAHFLVQYRSACSDLIFQDVGYSISKDIESKLWDSHGKVNNVFRKEIKKSRQDAGKGNPVEQRKIAKHFLDFIKSSQRFYRGYVQRLASCFDGIPELEAVANRLTLSTLSVDEPTQVSKQLSHAILLSCHRALVQLGDLSRWRETELVIKHRNWGPAIGYYDLARAMYPASGASHNQLAVIDLADCNHLGATYHLYRALAVEEPHPSAKGNLELQFRKATEAEEKDSAAIGSSAPKGSTAGEDLVTCFMRLHARRHKPSDIPGYEDHESMVMRQLTVDLQERSFESTFNKIVLINIAAEYFAGLRLKGINAEPRSVSSGDTSSAEMVQSYFDLLRFNVVTFSTLLNILLGELERCAGENSQSNGNKSRYAKLTIVTRRVLPGLRHYSSWLASNAAILTARVGDLALNIQVKELWTIYAHALTLLVSAFPVSELPPPVEYLLEEDEETLAFKPLDNDHAQHRYHSEVTGSRKPKWHDRGIQRQHPNIEMLGRVRDFLTDGMVIHCREDVPIQLIGTTFVYIEDGFPADGDCDETTFPYVGEGVPDDGSQADLASVAMDLASKRMVDELVDSETTDDGFEDPSRPQIGLAPMTELGNETSYGLFGTSTASELGGRLDMQDQPLLPSIYNSPFAPQPGERTSGSRPSTAKRSTPNHSRQSSQVMFPSQKHSGHAVGWSQISTLESAKSTSGPNEGYHKQSFTNATFPTKTNYTTGGSSSIIYRNDGYSTLDACHLISPTVEYGCSGSVNGTNRVTNVQTPPNGQGAR